MKPLYLLSAIALALLSLSACQKTSTDKTQAQTTSSATAASAVTATANKPTLKPNVSQQFVGDSLVEQRLKEALTEIAYTTDNLPELAVKVNQVSWSPTGAVFSSDMPASSAAASATAALTANASVIEPASAFHSTIDYSALRQTDTKLEVTKNAVKNEKVKAAAIKPDELVIFKTQALLNWHGHSVGPVTGTMNKNTIKAMQIFQQKHNLPISKEMNDATWAALTSDENLNKQPVFINYQLTRDDLITTRAPKDMQYKSAREAVAERFHMSQKLVSRLNPNTPLKVGSVITVYNPYQPNMTEVTKVVSDKKKNILYAYDAKGELVASYPTTVGSHYTPSPSGTLKVKNRVLNPTYNSDFSSKEKWLPPGPNNPVGNVWIGLSKRGYGIHGSPEPEMISSQKSHGCVRLTNWDALSLYGTIADGAEVIFL